MLVATIAYRQPVFFSSSVSFFWWPGGRPGASGDQP
jgi:hypothetical protein